MSPWALGGELGLHPTHAAKPSGTGTCVNKAVAIHRGDKGQQVTYAVPGKRARVRPTTPKFACVYRGKSGFKTILKATPPQRKSACSVLVSM